MDLCIFFGKQKAFVISEYVFTFNEQYEHDAATKACKEALWISLLVGDLGITELPVLQCDSESAIVLSWNPVFHA